MAGDDLSLSRFPPQHDATFRVRVRRLFPGDSQAFEAEVVDEKGGPRLTCSFAGRWVQLQHVLVPDDVLTLFGGKPHTRPPLDNLDLGYVLVFDDDCLTAKVSIQTWKDRVLLRPGKEYTLATLTPSSPSVASLSTSAPTLTHSHSLAQPPANVSLSHSSSHPCALSHSSLPTLDSNPSALSNTTSSVHTSHIPNSMSMHAPSVDLPSHSTTSSSSPLLSSAADPPPVRSANTKFSFSSLPPGTSSETKPDANIFEDLLTVFDHSSRSKKRKPKAPQPSEKAKKPAPSRVYLQYTPLSELAHKADQVYLYAIVVDKEPPKPCNNGNWKVSLFISDLSLPPLSRIELLAFRPTCLELPRPEVGDIIRVHRGKMSSFNDKLQVVIPDKGPATFLVISGKLDASLDPIQAPNGSAAEIDLEVVDALRRWASEHLHPSPEGKAPLKPEYYRSISQVDGRMTWVDLFVRVQYHDAEAKIMYVWDGTDCPLTLDRAPSSAALSACPPPALGTLLPIHLGFEPAFPPNKWLHIRNLLIRLNSANILSCVIQAAPLTKLDPRPEAEAKDVLAAYERRLLQEKSKPSAPVVPPVVWAPPAFVTVCRGELPYSSPLKSVLNFPRSPCRFRVRARVVGIRPLEVAQMTRPFCHLCGAFSATFECDKCHDSSDVRWEYSLQLLLRDRSGSVTTQLDLKQAVEFFSLPATDLSRDLVSLKALENKIAILKREDAWLDCGLVAFEPSEYGHDMTQLDFNDQTMFEARALQTSYQNATNLAVVDGRLPKKKLPGETRIHKIWDTTMC